MPIVRVALKWTGLALGALVGLAAVAALALYFVGGARLYKRYDVAVASIPVPTDQAAVDRGRHLAEAVTLCHACHGDDLEGSVLFEAPGIATVYASNLTSGRGGRTARYREVDYVRAIRHGINQDGRGLLIMHSDAYNGLGEEDLGALIAYLGSVPPADKEWPETSVRPLGRILVALGVFDSDVMPLIPAEVVDHEAPIPDAPPQGTTAEYGRYLASIALCSTCHGSDFRGGPPVEEGAPPTPNIAVYGMRGGWSEEQFIGTIRTGVTPYGKVLDAEAMPWEVYAKMTDDELMAIRRYLASMAEG